MERRETERDFQTNREGEIMESERALMDAILLAGRLYADEEGIEDRDRGCYSMLAELPLSDITKRITRALDAGGYSIDKV